MLVLLQREVDARTHEIAASHGAWPCRAGCDFCCRNLAEPPRLTSAEWKLVSEGLTRLADATRAEIQQRAEQPSRVCPFLDRDAGQCLIYEHRPIACRTYGFYVERDHGLYCRQIEERVDAGEMSEVVWGNVAGVDEQLAAMGEKIGLSDWLRAVPAPAPIPSSGCPDPDAGR
jgi:uncharacterized protein